MIRLLPRRAFGERAGREGFADSQWPAPFSTFFILATVHRSRCETAMRDLHCPAPSPISANLMARGAPGASNLLIRAGKYCGNSPLQNRCNRTLTVVSILIKPGCAFAGRRECGLHVHPVQIDCTISQDITEVLE